MENICVLSEKDELLFEEMYRLILEEKKVAFFSWRRNLVNALANDASSMSLRHDIVFYEEELNNIKHELGEGPGTAYRLVKFTRKRFKETCWTTPLQIENSRRYHLELVYKADMISEFADMYLYHDKIEYLEEKVKELPKYTIPTEVKIEQIHKLNKIIKVQKANNQINQPTSFQWLKDKSDTAGTKRQEQLQTLHFYLIRHHFIDNVSFNSFKSHFSGLTNNKSINWTKKQYQLIYLINSLKRFLNPDLFNAKNPSTTTLSKHFTFKGKPINIQSLNVTLAKKEGQISTQKETAIDFIIKTLHAK